MSITIQNEHAVATVSSKGGIVTNFSWYDSEIIYPERAVGEKSRGGIPICFPVFSHPPENFAEIPHHGWLRNQKLELIYITGKSVIFRGRALSENISFIIKPLAENPSALNNSFILRCHEKGEILWRACETS